MLQYYDKQQNLQTPGKGRKDDASKNRLDLVLPEFIEGIGEILTYGAVKYGEANSWKNLENGLDRHYAAAMRHLLAWRRGEKNDPETGKNHLYHVACNIMFLIYEDENEQ